MSKQLQLSFHNKLIVDLFAGGGGMSTAFERALGRSPDIAVNHSDDALSMHRINHPTTRHFVADVYEVCPLTVTRGVPVGWLHASPDCTHHSQAAGGQPRSKKIRGLAWVAYRWAGQVSPDVISLENVKQIQKWGPLVAKRDKATGRCLKRTVDGKGKTVFVPAAPGERVPVQDQYLVPDPKREGQTWRRFIGALQALGYAVEWRVSKAADFGGHTTRERLFLVARRDGLPIVWPAQTHFKAPEKGQKKWRPAADCIDFSDLGNSIFDRKKPLAEATLTRIARGVQKFVIENPQPFIVPVTHHGGENRSYSLDEPMRTVTAANRGEFAIVSPVMIQAAHGEGRADGVKRWGAGCRDAAEPLGTVTASGGHALEDPVSTVTNSGSQQQLVTAFLMTLRNNCVGVAADSPLPTVTSSGEHHGLVECDLLPDDEAGALRVAAFLVNYYGNGVPLDVSAPAATITTKDRLALVTVFISGHPYVIVDIRLRMLKPRELYNAQDFPPDYIIDRGHDGREFSISSQVRMVGNSVDPVHAAAIIGPNAPWLAVRRVA